MKPKVKPAGKLIIDVSKAIDIFNKRPKNKDNKLNQRKLANLTGISRQTFTNWKRANIELLDMIQKIEEVTGVNKSNFLIIKKDGE